MSVLGLGSYLGRGRGSVQDHGSLRAIQSRAEAAATNGRLGMVIYNVSRITDIVVSCLASRASVSQNRRE
jgi:hypothetical protein